MYAELAQLRDGVTACGVAAVRSNCTGNPYAVIPASDTVDVQDRGLVDSEDIVELMVGRSVRALLAGGNQISQLSITPSFASLQRLHVDGCGLMELPAAFSALVHLVDVVACDNALTGLPDMSRLVSLAALRLDNNRIAAFPDSLCACTSLMDLHLSGNPAPALPEDMGQLTRLRDLQLSCCVARLPTSLARCLRLEVLFTADGEAYFDNVPPHVFAEGPAAVRAHLMLSG